MLAQLFRQLLTDIRSLSIPIRVQRMMRRFIADIEFRSRIPKDDPRYQKLDDKWLFTRTFFEKHASSCGFSSCVIQPIDKAEGLFRRQVEFRLRVVLNKSLQCLPSWALRRIDAFDRCFSDDFRSELIVDGSIVLVK